MLFPFSIDLIDLSGVAIEDIAPFFLHRWGEHVIFGGPLIRDEFEDLDLLFGFELGVDPIDFF